MYAVKSDDTVQIVENINSMVGLVYEDINGFKVTLLNGDINWSLEEKADDYVERQFVFI